MTDSYVNTLMEAVKSSHDAGRYEEAVNAVKFLVGNNDDEAYVLYVLGHIQYELRQYDQAAVALEASVRIDPTRAPAFNDLAASLFALERPAEALPYITRALDLDPNLAEAEETDAHYLLLLGQFAQGWRKYEARTRTILGQKMIQDFPVPRWRGENLHGRTILLHAEQGIGDTIQFLRYAPLVAERGGRVIVQLHHGLRPLLSQMHGLHQVLERGEALPSFDLHCPMLSLPFCFKTDLDSIPAHIPYLTVPERTTLAWRARLGPRRTKRIGLAWSGNPRHRDDAQRSIPLARFASLLAARPDREFHVLQNIVRPADRAVLDRLPHVHDHSGTLRDFADTGALLSLMDVVISVDTSIAHLAGALGWPVWLLLPSRPDWRWMLVRDDSPWYPTMWLFRQPTRGDWDSVLGEVARRLDDMLS